MTVSRTDEFVLHVDGPAAARAVIREALAADPDFTDLVETPEGFVFTHTPRWSMLLTTAVHLELVATGNGALVRLTTTSQALVKGDIFRMYPRYSVGCEQRSRRRRRPPVPGRTRYWRRVSDTRLRPRSR